MKPKSRPLPLLERIHSLQVVSVNARGFFHAWWTLANDMNRPKYVSAMSAYSEFFRAAEVALLHSALVQVAMFVDHRKDALSWTKLVNEASMEAQKNGYNTKDIEAASAIFQFQKEHLEKAKILRHNVIAHRSMYHSFSDVFLEAKLSPNQFGALTEKLVEATNLLASAVMLPEIHASEHAGPDTLRLLEAIKGT